MRKLYSRVLLLFSACFLSGTTIGWGQEISTQGRDFWVSFLPNFPEATAKLELYVAGSLPCTGKAVNPVTGWSASFSVTPGEVTSVVIPNSEGLLEKENRTEHKAIHITTTEDVSLYASNFADHTFDVANVLPTAILGDHYIAQAYNRPDNGEASKMLIVGTENNTEITVDPKGALRGVFPPYSKKVISLNAGDCYLFISGTGDISGTSVHVKDGKKVAVFSGGDTQIPPDGCCYDAVFEQCVPLSNWGRHFVVTASAERKNDMIRITSLAPGCRISIDGKYRRTLGAKNHFDYKLDGTKKEAVYISASSPVFVCLYLTSSTMGGEMGDPSMVNINPIEQQMDKVTFCTYNTAVSKLHYVNVITQTHHVDHITLDGTGIASEFKPVPQKKELSYARIPVNHGSHTLKSTDGGFVAHIYGLGPYESYAYSVGSSSKVLNEFDDEGNLLVSVIPDDPDDLEEADSAETDYDVPTYSRTDTLKAVGIGSITLAALKRGETITGQFEDPDGLVIDPDQFDVSVESDFDYLFDKMDAELDGNTVLMHFHLRKPLCDCFVPKKLIIRIVLVPVSAENGASRIVIQDEQSIAKDRPWMERCMTVLLLMAGLILFLLYLLCLLRKKRFKKNAAVIPSYYDYRGKRIDQGGFVLRKKGVKAWLARWLWPGDEKTVVNCSMPEALIRFVAAPSSDTVLLPKTRNIDSDSIAITGYNPKKDPHPDEPLTLAGNGRIKIIGPQGKEKGFLTFLPGSGNDGGIYRMVLFVLTAAMALAILMLLVLLIRGLL